MSQLINILVLLAFIGGVIGVIALWTQHDLNRQREKDSATKKPTGDHNA